MRGLGRRRTELSWGGMIRPRTTQATVADGMVRTMVIFPKLQIGLGVPAMVSRLALLVLNTACQRGHPGMRPGLASILQITKSVHGGAAKQPFSCADNSNSV